MFVRTSSGHLTPRLKASTLSERRGSRPRSRLSSGSSPSRKRPWLNLTTSTSADGSAVVLVHFELRDGHVRASRQRLCGEAAAKPRVATMRRGWLDFARRNTELAARLAETDSR